MDYQYYVKDKGLVDPVKFKALLDILENREMVEIPRFSEANKVLGLLYQQDPEVDKIVKDLLDTLVIPEIVGNPISTYWSIHYMPPHSKILEHSDITNGVSWDDLWTHKMHIVLKTNPKVKFGFRRNLNTSKEWLTLETGHMYMYNNLAFHEVVNDSDEYRIHLIFYSHDKKMRAHYNTNLNKRAPNGL